MAAVQFRNLFIPPYYQLMLFNVSTAVLSTLNQKISAMTRAWHKMSHSRTKQKVRFMFSMTVVEISFMKFIKNSFWCRLCTKKKDFSDGFYDENCMVIVQGNIYILCSLWVDSYFFLRMIRMNIEMSLQFCKLRKIQTVRMSNTYPTIVISLRIITNCVMSLIAIIIFTNNVIRNFLHS